MFTSRHFFKRHARHWFLWVLSTGHPPCTERGRDGERKRVTASGWISLSLQDGRLLAIIFPGGQSPGEISRYYRAVIGLLPCGSSASSFRRISTPSRPLLPKSSPSSHHIRLDYTWHIIAARCLAQYLMVEAWHNETHQGRFNTAPEGKSK